MPLTHEEMPTTPAGARGVFREGKWTQSTDGLCRGYSHANLAIVPRDMAYATFCSSPSVTLSPVRCWRCWNPAIP